MKPVIVESPFKGKTPAEQRRNIRYARALAHDCLVNHHESPFLSHLLYTQPGILDDAIPEERQLGIDAGLVWGRVAEASIIGIDFGISGGMIYGIKNAIRVGRHLEYRKLYQGCRKIAKYQPRRISVQTGIGMERFDAPADLTASQIEKIIQIAYGKKSDITTFSWRSDPIRQ